ncbi:hypothetical protein [Pseudoalteromonas sp. S2755]|uniref:helix-turn-helix domain-containing protein n=1 Tax=Pseudoalteromonas sp. S2755 TaxID=2066523 RepID=UPI00110B3260|nr:hypothetical protein [Pseudoalteromonas sp. S2755]TMN40749.1 hypothetical protein CWC03_08285 [Pseudoalteromonas sp. S2755]
MTGISKAMFEQIERFESSPTVELLWELAQGIGIEYALLLDSSDPQNSNNSINQLTCARTLTNTVTKPISAEEF